MALFEPGEIVVTRTVADAMRAEPRMEMLVNEFLRRHLAGDWGVVNDEDKQQNAEALEEGQRLMSAYDLPPGCDQERIWIITEKDRSVTTILYPDDY